MFYLLNLISKAFVLVVGMCIFPASKIIPFRDLGTVAA